MRAAPFLRTLRRIPGSSLPIDHRYKAGNDHLSGREPCLGRIEPMETYQGAGSPARILPAILHTPSTFATRLCAYWWRIRSGDRWRSQPSRNHGTRCARSNNNVVVAGFEVFLPRGLICCDCEDLICDRGRLGGPGAGRGCAVKDCRAADLAGQQLPLAAG